MFIKGVAAFGLACALGCGVSPALALTTFQGINIDQEDLSGQLGVEVVDTTATASGTVGFKFTNNVGIASSVTDIYFDAVGFLTGIHSIQASAGVAFDHPASPGSLPEEGNATPPFDTTANLSADSNGGSGGGVPGNGVNLSSEWVTVILNLATGKTIADIIASLGQVDGVRIGLHVQSIGQRGGSDSYVTSVVPIPPALLLLGSAIVGLGAMRFRSRPLASAA